VYGTSAADEDHHQYQAAVGAGGGNGSVGGGGGGGGGGGSAGCYAQTDVKPSTRVRSYESEKVTYTIIVLISVLQKIGTSTRIKGLREVTKGFSVGAGVHQGF